jgi:hypothetical protein
MTTKDAASEVRVKGRETRLEHGDRGYSLWTSDGKEVWGTNGEWNKYRLLHEVRFWPTREAAEAFLLSHADAPPAAPAPEKAPLVGKCVVEVSGRLSDTDRTLELIELLSMDEGASVNILCPNPDFNGQPDRAIEVSADWTGWHPKRFAANTLLQCLEDALTAQQASGNREKLAGHYGHLAAAPASEPTGELPWAIMNIPCRTPASENAYGAYERGHRDARHAAAELATAELSRLRAERDGLERSNHGWAEAMSEILADDWDEVLPTGLRIPVMRGTPDLPQKVQSLRQRLERAEGARDRLRVALKDIIEGRDGMLHVCDDPEDGCADLWNEFIEAGRAALADKGATDAE